MTKKYIVKYFSNRSMEVSKPNSSILLYKIPYECLKNKTHGIEITNRFVVYILYGKSDVSKDIIYVGKSKNGIDYRPTSHEDKNTNWNDCYVLTNFKEKTFFNDGTIQYIEDKLKQKIDSLKQYINVTKQTTSGTANNSDEEDCDEYLREAYDMLYALGLDLIVPNSREIIEETEMSSGYSLDTIPRYEQYRDLLGAIEKSAKEVNPDITPRYTKLYINYLLDEKIIFGVEPFKSHLKVVFNCDIGELEDKYSVLEDISAIGHHCNGNCQLRMTDITKIEILQDYINQVINL